MKADDLTDDQIRAIRDLADAMEATEVARTCTEALQRDAAYAFLCDHAAARERLVPVVAAIETAHARLFPKGHRP